MHRKEPGGGRKHSGPTAAAAFYFSPGKGQPRAPPRDHCSVERCPHPRARGLVHKHSMHKDTCVHAYDRTHIAHSCTCTHTHSTGKLTGLQTRAYAHFQAHGGPAQQAHSQQMHTLAHCTQEHGARQLLHRAFYSSGNDYWNWHCTPVFGCPQCIGALVILFPHNCTSCLTLPSVYLHLTFSLKIPFCQVLIL